MPPAAPFRGPPFLLGAGEHTLLLGWWEPHHLLVMSEGQPWTPLLHVHPARDPLEVSERPGVVARALSQLGIRRSPPPLPVRKQIPDPEVDVLLDVHEIVQATQPLLAARAAHRNEAALLEAEAADR